MLDATRMALPRSLERRGLTLKSNTMSLTTRSMRDLELSTFCMVPHFFFSSSFCQSFNPLVLALEPRVDLVFRAEPLVDVARLVNKVENDSVLHAFAELVGANVPAESFQAGLLVLLQQRCAGETDEHGVRHHRFHRAMQFAALRSVAFI